MEKEPLLRLFTQSLLHYCEHFHLLNPSEMFAPFISLRVD